MINGVIYARYSCEKQTENSILGQVRECLEYAFDIETHDNSMRMWFISTFINKIILSDQEVVVLFKYNNNFGDEGSRFNFVQNYSQPVYQS